MRRLLLPSLFVGLIACNHDKASGGPAEEEVVPYTPPDNDGDGYAADVDCDDDDAAIHPDAIELCDGINNDCDTVIDEPGDGGDPWFRDADGDGFGDESATITSCEQPPGYIADATDCDDASAAVSPSTPELCNDGLDNNCNGDETECARTGEVLVSAADATFTGAGTGERLTGPMAGADLTGDGVGDLIIGSPRNDAGGVDSGGAFLFPGPLSGGSAGLATAPIALRGTSSSLNAGSSLWAGDLNHDGIGDLLLGAPKGRGGGTDSGEAWLLLGPITADSALSAPTLRIIGEVTYDIAGNSVSGAGDLTGDGVDDLLIGSTGQGDASLQQQGAAYVVSGAATGELDLSLASAKVTGDEDYDRLGTKVIGRADTDGDGVAELITSGYTWPSNDNQGAVWIFEGPLTGITVAADADARLEGEERNDQAGTSLAAGDLNDDGKDDLLIGAPYADDGTDEQGVVYAMTGPFTGAVSMSTAALRLLGPNARDRVGIDVAAGGDADGNGVADLMIGGTAADTATTDSGGAWLLYGPIASGTATLDASGIALRSSTRDELGGAVAFLGELSGDLTEDLAVGAAASDIGGTDAGAVFVLFGQGL